MAEQLTNAATREAIDPLESDEEEEQEDEKEGAQDECDGEGHQFRWWHVNKTGFPISEETWDRMWDHVIRVHPQGSRVAESIRGSPVVKKVVSH